MRWLRPATTRRCRSAGCARFGEDHPLFRQWCSTCASPAASASTSAGRRALPARRSCAGADDAGEPLAAHRLRAKGLISPCTTIHRRGGVALAEQALPRAPGDARGRRPLQPREGGFVRAPEHGQRAARKACGSISRRAMRGRSSRVISSGSSAWSMSIAHPSLPGLRKRLARRAVGLGRQRPASASSLPAGRGAASGWCDTSTLLPLSRRVKRISPRIGTPKTSRSQRT